MKKFRVLSDLHVDINRKVPLELEDKDVFTVICGDLAGETEMAVDWLNKNVKNGVFVSGNHMPYNSSMMSMQEQRENLAKLYPVENNVTYLDTECQTFFKEVDGLLFIGTCMYSDMHIETRWNINGDVLVNSRTAERHMNDYKFGLKSVERDVDGKVINFKRITAKDYIEWFNHAFELIDKKITENEALENPKPVILITHFPLIKKILEESYYVDPDNMASYGSDHEKWIMSHPSIKCYCCGHAHEVGKDFRTYSLEREDGSKCLVVSNTRGYVYNCHDKLFNPNTFVNVTSWTIEVEPESPEETERKNKAMDRFLATSAWFL